MKLYVNKYTKKEFGSKEEFIEDALKSVLEVVDVTKLTLREELERYLEANLYDMMYTYKVVKDNSNGIGKTDRGVKFVIEFKHKKYKGIKFKVTYTPNLQSYSSVSTLDGIYGEVLGKGTGIDKVLSYLKMHEIFKVKGDLIGGKLKYKANTNSLEYKFTYNGIEYQIDYHINEQDNTKQFRRSDILLGLVDGSIKGLTLKCKLKGYGMVDSIVVGEDGVDYGISLEDVNYYTRGRKLRVEKGDK